MVATPTFGSTPTLTVPQGGTGNGTFTSSRLIYGNGTNALTSVATSSITYSSPLSTSGTAGYIVGGSGYTISCPSCNTSSASVTSVGLSDSNSTLTIGSTPVTTSGTITATLNLGHTNVWTILQNFSNASSTIFSSLNGAYFGATATSSFNSVGALTLITPLLATSGGTGATSLAAGLSVVSNALSQIEHPSFQYSTSTAWTGTTTVFLQLGYGEIFNSVQCATDVGTIGVDFYHASSHLNYIPTASTTANVFTFTTNNTITASDLTKVDLGTPASSPTKIICTVKDTI